MGGDPSFLLLPEMLETDLIENGKKCLDWGQGVHQMGTSPAPCCRGLQLGWDLQAASCKAKANEQ